MLRCELFDHKAGARIREGGGEAHQLLFVLRADEKLDEPRIPPQRGLDGIHQPRLHTLADDETIDDDLDGVRLAARGLQIFLEFDDLAVDSHAHETLTAELFQQAAPVAFLLLHHGREHGDSCAFRQSEHAIADLSRRALHQHLARLGIVRLTGDGVKHAEVIVNLRDRGDGRARIRRAVPLLDGDGGREALDEIDIGLLHLIEKLPRVGREALHVAALAFGVESVERE